MNGSTIASRKTDAGDSAIMQYQDPFVPAKAGTQGHLDFPLKFAPAGAEMSGVSV